MKYLQQQVVNSGNVLYIIPAAATSSNKFLTGKSSTVGSPPTLVSFRTLSRADSRTPPEGEAPPAGDSIEEVLLLAAEQKKITLHVESMLAIQALQCHTRHLQLCPGKNIDNDTEAIR
jgi:hypothetical protein